MLVERAAAGGGSPGAPRRAAAAASAAAAAGLAHRLHAERLGERVRLGDVVDRPGGHRGGAQRVDPLAPRGARAAPPPAAPRARRRAPRARCWSRSARRSASSGSPSTSHSRANSRSLPTATAIGRSAASKVSYGAMLGWRLPRRCGTTPPSTQAEPWLSSDISAASISETSTWRPAPGARALGQRALDPDHREQPADEVDDRRAGLQRPPVLLAGDAHQPAHRLREEVVAGQRARRLAGAERGHRAGDEARVGSRAACRRRAPSAPSARGGRTRSARRRGRPAGARARRSPASPRSSASERLLRFRPR